MKVAVLGCGNMAEALTSALFFAKSEFECHAWEPDNSKAKQLAEIRGGISYNEIEDLPQCDIYMIGCKPQQFESLAETLKPLIKSDATILSMMAGVTEAKISSALGINKVIRTMPNTPVMIGEGVIALHASKEVEKGMTTNIATKLERVSSVFTFASEGEIDIITGFSGSGPAYFFEIVRVMIEKLTSMGIDKDIASEMIKKTILGSSKMMMDSNDTPETLRNKVTSKNGVTYEALETLKEYKLEEAFSVALDNAYQRAKELSD